MREKTIKLGHLLVPREKLPGPLIGKGSLRGADEVLVELLHTRGEFGHYKYANSISEVDFATVSLQTDALGNTKQKGFSPAQYSGALLSAVLRLEPHQRDPIEERRLCGVLSVGIQGRFGVDVQQVQSEQNPQVS